jgi:Siphovirus Gp157
MRLDPQIVRNQISNLLAVYPDLASDEEDLSLALASETELDEFLTKLVRMIDDSKALVEGTDLRMEELASRQTRFKRRIEAYRSLIFKLMETANQRRRELPDATISLRATPVKVIGDPDADKLPDNLVKIERKPNREAIKAALEGGEAVEGCSLSNSGVSLSIKVK